ncbi:hypothetical protein A9798_02830 [Edwardsiella hoshinae]|uniref:Secreted protein n=1 Tax=Edwardsiella hoshinae TaxID=93378 RepID=A0ABN4SSX3_9GAMM|nr:hypothetical protein A9798_02830 [Edwardsiella hoshinae]
MAHSAVQGWLIAIMLHAPRRGERGMRGMTGGAMGWGVTAGEESESARVRRMFTASRFDLGGLFSVQFILLRDRLPY